MQHRSSAQPPAKLERLGRYRIIRPLSKGGMALVYEARRESLAGVSPRVAIKLILPDYAASDAFQELFINEARMGAAMQHQNLVQIQDFDRDGDHFFLVMEYVEGLTLRRMISLCARQGIAIPLSVILEIGRQACDGLHHAHAAHDEQGRHLGLVHRDIKPSNLILNPQGVVKVLDFGVSKGRLIRERKGAVKGTWGYMAPEQAVGEDVGPSADMFGLAAVLYEMAARRALFEERDPEVIKKQLADDHAARMATRLDPAYAPLVGVLVRALQRDPRARHASVAEFGRALASLLPDPITARDEVTRFYEVIDALNRGVPIPAGKGPVTSPSAPASGSMVRTGGPATEHEAPSLVWILALVGGLTVAVVGVVLLAIMALARVDFAPDAAPGLVETMPDPIEAADEPPGPAGEDAPGEARPAPAPLRTAPAEATRPPPATTVPPPEPRAAPPTAAPPPADEPVVVVVHRQPPPEPPAAQDPPPPEAQPAQTAPDPEGTGRITIAALPSVLEVYVDGRVVNRGPIARYEVPAGRRVITIVARDGRRKTFELDVAPDQEIRRHWHFDRAEWR